jgi:hypothetical protein
MKSVIARFLTRINSFSRFQTPESRWTKARKQKFSIEPLEGRILPSADAAGFLIDATNDAVPTPVMEVSLTTNDSVDAGPSTIVWDNRGAASDGFDAVFGAGVAANQARAVIDAAIDFWERIITDFHYSDGSHDMHVTISIDPSDTGFGGGASINTILDGKVKEGTITLDSGNDTDADGDGDGAGWFIDLTPFDWSEFSGNLVNAFAGDAQAGSPANGLNDLFTVVAAELTHVMGINSNTGVRLHTGGFETDTGIPDDAEGGGVGNFWIFNGPSIDHLMTANNGGPGGSDRGRIVHTAGPRTNNAPIVFGGLTLFGSEDAGNASYEGSRRYLPRGCADPERRLRLRYQLA